MTEPPSKFCQIHSNASQRADKSNAASTLNEIRERERVRERGGERERERERISLVELNFAIQWFDDINLDCLVTKKLEVMEYQICADCSPYRY
jgi:hypothetical protein